MGSRKGMGALGGNIHWPCGFLSSWRIAAKWTRRGPSKRVIPNLFGTSNWFCRRQFFPWTRARGWFGEDSSTLHLLYTSFVLLLHQLPLRSSIPRSQRLGNPALKCGTQRRGQTGEIRQLGWTVQPRVGKLLKRSWRPQVRWWPRNRWQR